MNLKYTLPDREAAALRPLLRKEKMVYCIPCDMTPDGQAAADRWTVVTPGRLFLLTGGEVTETVKGRPVSGGASRWSAALRWLVGCCW